MENPSHATHQPPPHLPAPRRLVRRPDQGPLGGVCAGVAEYFNVDPTIVRIAAVVLAFMGPGVPGYLIAWAFVPKADGASVAASVGPGAGQRDRGTQILGIVLMVVAVSILWGDWWIPGRGWLVPLGLIGLGAWLLLRNDDEPGPIPAAPPPPTSPAGTTSPWTATSPSTGVAADATDGRGATGVGAPGGEHDDTTTGDDPTITQLVDGGAPPVTPPPYLGGADGPIEPPPAVPSPRRRVVGPIVFGALFLWGGIAWLAGIEVDTGLAVALCIVGLGFVLGAFIGGSWTLLPPAVLIAIALVFTSIVDIPFEGGIGEKQWRPIGSSQLEDTYELGIGEGTLDLSGLDLRPGEEVDIRVHQGIGHLLVFVPAGTSVDVVAEVGMGQADVLGRRDDGMGVELSREVTGDRANGSIDLDLDLGIGHIEVIAVGDGVGRDPVLTLPTGPSLPR